MARGPKKYTDEEIAEATRQEESDQTQEMLAMLRSRCIGLRMELNRAKARIAELEAPGE